MSLAMMGCSGPDPVPAQRLASAQARARGERLYIQHCTLCHGANADGHGLRREGLTGTPVDFTSAAWRASSSVARVYEVIRDGEAGSSMPAWRSLDDDQIKDLVAYVWSRSEPDGEQSR